MTRFVSQIGKTPVRVKDTPGYVVNRLHIPYFLDAVQLLEAGVATEEDIDKAVELGLNYPTGPLRLIDLAGRKSTKNPVQENIKTTEPYA